MSKFDYISVLMPIYTKKEFAEICGMTTAKLSTYASPDRKKVIYTGDYINSSIEPNITFLAKWSARKIEKQSDEPTEIPKLKVPAAVKKELRMARAPKMAEMLVKDDDQDEEDEGSGPSENAFSGMEAKKLATQIRKMEKEIEKLTLSNQKTRGQVVPVEPINSLVLQDRQSILIEMKNVLMDVLTIFAKRRDLTAYERAEISSEFTDRLNEAMKRAAEMTEKAVEAIVGEYSIKKGKGERE